MTFSVPLHKAVSVQKEPRPPLNSFQQHVSFCEHRPLPYLGSQFDISGACIWFLSFATKRAWFVQPWQVLQFYQSLEKSFNLVTSLKSTWYKHQWNTKWAFARKLHIFTREDKMLSSHVKRSPSLWLHYKSRLWKQADLVFHWCLFNKQNSTYSLMDMNFIFSCLTWYRVDHSKIKLISTRGHLISSISLLVLEKSLKFRSHFPPYHFSDKWNYFAADNLFTNF